MRRDHDREHTDYLEHDQAGGELGLYGDLASGKAGGKRWHFVRSAVLLWGDLEPRASHQALEVAPRRRLRLAAGVTMHCFARVDRILSQEQPIACRIRIGRVPILCVLRASAARKAKNHHERARKQRLPATTGAE